MQIRLVAAIISVSALSCNGNIASYENKNQGWYKHKHRDISI